MDHDPAQAREFPQSLRRFPAGEDRALQRQESPRADERCRHRPQPRQDRRRRQQRQVLSEDHGGRPGLLEIPVGLRRRQAEGQRSSRPPPACRPRRRSRSRFQRSSARAASSSSARPSSTPSCRPPAWSTTIWSPASATRPAAANFASPASRPNDGAKTSQPRHRPRLAADAVGAAARSARPLAARYRDRRYRPWAGARRALERADQRRAYFLGGAAHAAGRSRDARADAARRRPLPARRAAARRAGICHRRHDLAVQGGARRRLQGGGEAPAGGDPYPLRPAAGAGRRNHASRSRPPTAARPISKRRIWPAFRKPRPSACSAAIPACPSRRCATI